VIDRVRRAALADEALGHALVARDLGLHELERDATLEQHILRLVHSAHPACAEQA